MMKARTIPEIIDAFGGTSAFARVIGVKQSAASEMKRRGRISPDYWKRIIAAEPVTGDKVTAEELIEAHASEDAAT